MWGVLGVVCLQIGKLLLLPAPSPVMLAHARPCLSTATSFGWRSSARICCDPQCKMTRMLAHFVVRKKGWFMHRRTHFPHKARQ